MRALLGRALDCLPDGQGRALVLDALRVLELEAVELDDTAELA